METTETLKNEIISTLHTVYDPEIPVDIYELGMIYNIDITEDKNVSVQMTLTSPACPVAGSLPSEVEAKIKSVPGVTGCKVELVWDPPWGQEMMSETARLKLNLF